MNSTDTFLKEFAKRPRKYNTPLVGGDLKPVIFTQSACEELIETDSGKQIVENIKRQFGDVSEENVNLLKDTFGLKNIKK